MTGRVLAAAAAILVGGLPVGPAATAGTAPSQGAPVPSTSFRQVDAPVTWRVLSAGETSGCGISRAGAAWCWGGNAHGQLGRDALRGWSQTPVKVDGGALGLGQRRLGRAR